MLSLIFEELLHFVGLRLHLLDVRPVLERARQLLLNEALVLVHLEQVLDVLPVHVGYWLRRLNSPSFDLRLDVDVVSFALV